MAPLNLDNASMIIMLINPGPAGREMQKDPEKLSSVETLSSKCQSTQAQIQPKQEPDLHRILSNF